MFADLWHDFLENSPWKDDTFLSERDPVGVTVRYGQNTKVCYSDTDVEWNDSEVDEWIKQRRWNRLRFVTLALATHISYVWTFSP